MARLELIRFQGAGIQTAWSASLPFFIPLDEIVIVSPVHSEWIER